MRSRVVSSPGSLIGASQGGRGRMTMQLVPILTDGSLSKKMEPSINSTKCFAMANPKPVPGSPPRWTKRWKSFSWSRFGIPGPVSSHSKRRVSLSCHPNVSVIEPVPVYLMLFREREIGVRCQHGSNLVQSTIVSVIVITVMSLTHSSRRSSTLVAYDESPRPPNLVLP
jgi:hypothetical protein